MVRDVLDLPPHPQVAVPGKGRAQCALDLLVEAADGEDPAALPGVPLGRWGGLGTAGRSPAVRAAATSGADSGGASGSKS